MSAVEQAEALRTDTICTRIHGYEIELELFVENGEQRSFCDISKRERGYEYCGSLERLRCYGTLECYDHAIPCYIKPEIEVSDYVIDEIGAWAERNGY